MGVGKGRKGLGCSSSRVVKVIIREMGGGREAGRELKQSALPLLSAQWVTRGELRRGKSSEVGTPNKSQ